MRSGWPVNCFVSSIRPRQRDWASGTGTANRQAAVSLGSRIGPFLASRVHSADAELALKFSVGSHVTGKDPPAGLAHRAVKVPASPGVQK